MAHSSTSHGFVYNSGIYSLLDNPLGAYGTLALGINNLDQVVGVYFTYANANAARSAGFTSYISKPVKLPALRSELARLLS